MSDKYYVSAEGLLYDSYRLARKVLDAEFKPDFLVGLWRGGTPVGIAVQEFLAYHKVEADHIAIRTSKYTGIDKAEDTVRVHGLDYLVERVSPEHKVLFVDDVYDTGLSLKAVLDTLHTKARRNTPVDIKIATVYYKPTRNKTERVPDFYIHETEQWLVFPHELQDLTEEEILQGKGPRVLELLSRK